MLAIQIQNIKAAVDSILSDCSSCKENHTRAIERAENVLKELHKEKLDKAASQRIEACNKCKADRLEECKICKASIVESLGKEIEQRIESTIKPPIPKEEKTPVATSLIPYTLPPETSTSENPFDFCLGLRKDWFSSNQNESFDEFILRRKRESISVEGKE
ncbi:MAG: hypothetical protein PHX21_12730 [bacterium]|nr:hypothetical protein [bacterium]